MKMRRAATILVFLIATALAAGAQSMQDLVAGFPDYVKMRAEFLSAVITAHPSVALAFAPKTRDTPAGKVRVSVEAAGNVFFVMFLRERDGQYPYASRGNMIIERDTKTGYVLRVVWYLSDDGMSWLSMTPKNERTILDYIVAGGLRRGGYTMSRLVYQFFTGTFVATWQATRTALDWSLVFGQSSAPEDLDLAASLEAISHRLPGPLPPSAAPSSPGVAMSPVTGIPPGSALAGSAGVSGSTAMGVSPLALALLTAANDFTMVGAYLRLVGEPSAEPVEVTDPGFTRAMQVPGGRNPAVATLPAWSDTRGLPVTALPGAVLAGCSGGQSVYLALVEGAAGEPPLNLAVVPVRQTDGLCELVAYTPRGRRLTLADVVSGHPGATVRLFELPAPSRH